MAMVDFGGTSLHHRIYEFNSDSLAFPLITEN